MHLRVSKPPHANALALIQPDALTIGIQENQSRGWDNALPGLLVRLTLEKALSGVIALVMVEDLSFTVRLSQEQIAEMGLYPGRKVWVRFQAKNIKWHNANLTNR
jgi:hypothetical protein